MARAARVLFAAAACLLAVSAHAQQAAPEAVFDRFTQALAAGDLGAMMALHSADAVLVPSAGGPFVKGKDAIEAYYKGIFARTKSRRAIVTPGADMWQVYGDTAIRTSNGIFEIETDQDKKSLPLRNTYIFHKEGGDWKLVNSHISNRTTTTSEASATGSTSK